MKPRHYSSKSLTALEQLFSGEVKTDDIPMATLRQETATTSTTMDPLDEEVERHLWESSFLMFHVLASRFIWSKKKKGPLLTWKYPPLFQRTSCFRQPWRWECGRRWISWKARTKSGLYTWSSFLRQSLLGDGTEEQVETILSKSRSAG